MQTRHPGLSSPLSIVCSAVSYSSWPHGRSPPGWDYSSKNTGAGCHFLLQGTLPNPESKAESPVALALADGFLSHLGIPFPLLLLFNLFPSPVNTISAFLSPNRLHCHCSCSTVSCFDAGSFGLQSGVHIPEYWSYPGMGKKIVLLLPFIFPHSFYISIISHFIMYSTCQY